MTDVTKNITSWRVCLSECALDIVHCAGIKHQAADEVFLLPTIGCYNVSLDTDVVALMTFKSAYVGQLLTINLTKQTQSPLIGTVKMAATKLDMSLV